MSAIFYHDAEQQRLALDSKAREEARLGTTLYTEIVSAARFYMAEDYHQKYYLRGDRVLLAEFQAMYPDDSALVDSTVAARLNGYAGHNGLCRNLQAEVTDYGLSAAGEQKLLKTVCR
jgi:peptide-methionine (S)-S-oxide reductase